MGLGCEAGPLLWIREGGGGPGREEMKGGGPRGLPPIWRLFAMASERDEELGYGGCWGLLLGLGGGPGRGRG